MTASARWLAASQFANADPWEVTWPPSAMGTVLENARTSNSGRGPESAHYSMAFLNSVNHS